MLGRKIKSCGKCLRSFTWDEWHALEAVWTLANGAEMRHCDRCNYLLTCAVSYFATRELRTDEERESAAAGYIRGLGERASRRLWAKRIAVATALAAAIAGTLVVFW